MPGEAIESQRDWAPILARQEHPALIIGPGRKVLAASASFRARFTGGEDPAGRFCFQLLHRGHPPCVGAGGRCPLEMAGADAAPAVHRHLTCLGASYEQVTARRLTNGGESPGTFLLVSRPLAPAPNSWFLVGGSLALLRLLEKVAQLAAEECAVLIRGEPGTGRACVARLLHDLSRRASGPFVPGDCSAVEVVRLERVLFGHAKPLGMRSAGDQGLYSVAAGGTLFLREPQRLPPSVQRRIALLLAGDESVCRWVFAVEQAAASPHGALQSVLAPAKSILVPPLRDRIEDLPLLLETLVRRFGGADPPLVDPEVGDLLKGYAFPGNLRELECLVERACLVASGGHLRAEHLSPQVH